jgi:thioredoxin-dependent peroxiredoxin
MLGAGDRAPDFVLLDETSSPTSLAGLLQHGPLLLYFYPADFTPVCTREACLFRDTYVELNAAGLNVAGISPDTPESHARFKQRHALNYPLLSDPAKEAIRAYGVAGPFGLGVRRATFLLDANGWVVDALLADLRVGRHEAFIRAALARAEPS